MRFSLVEGNKGNLPRSNASCSFNEICSGTSIVEDALMGVVSLQDFKSSTDPSNRGFVQGMLCILISASMFTSPSGFVSMAVYSSPHIVVSFSGWDPSTIESLAIVSAGYMAAGIGTFSSFPFKFEPSIGFWSRWEFCASRCGPVNSKASSFSSSTEPSCSTQSVIFLDNQSFNNL